MEARLGRSVALLHAAFSVFPDSVGILEQALKQPFLLASPRTIPTKPRTIPTKPRCEKHSVTRSNIWE